MANTVFKLRRSSVPGKVPNTDILSIGELALNLTDRKLYSSDGTNIFETGSNLTSLSVFSDIKVGNSTVNTVINSSSLSVTSIIANGSVGNNQQILASNGSGNYWTDAGSGTVTSVATGNGLSGGPITTTGTVSVLANTGLVANTTGLYVNAAYINTISSNNTNFVGTVSAANVVSNAQLSSNLSNYQTIAGLASNVATLTANNSDNLGGIVAAAYVQNTDSRTLSGNLVFSGANVAFTGNARFSGGIIANGSLGTSGHTLHSNGSATYWAVDDAGVTSVSTGNGLTGGTITTTGTISILANNGLSANATGVYVVPGNGLVAVNSTGVHVGQGTGIVVNSTAVAVNAAYINTISSNTARFLTGNTTTNSFAVGTSAYFVSNGNFGIGNSVPTTKLSVSGTSYFQNTVNVDGGLTSKYLSFEYSNSCSMWSYSGTSFSVAAQETSPSGLFFTPNGTVMFITGQATDSVIQYNLSTAWNVSTASFVKTANATIIGQSGIDDVFFSPNGSIMYTVGFTTDAIRQFSLSTPWDIGTISFVNSYSVAAQDTEPRGLYIKSDGTKAYVIGNQTDNTYEYTFGTPWNITTLSYTAGAFVNNTPQDTSCTGLDFEDDGKSLFIVGSTGDCVYQYSLSTPWSINSASFVALKYLGYEEGTPLAIWVDASENKAWVVGSSADRVYEYKTNNFGLYANSVVNYITSNTEFENNLYVNGQLRSRGTILGLGAATFLSTLTGAGSVTFSTTTGTLSIGTSQSTGTTTVGGTTQTGSIQIGRSTATQIISIANGATTSGNTKTINIGTDSATGSNTNITIGSTLGNSALSFNGTSTFNGTITVTGNIVSNAIIKVYNTANTQLFP